MDKMNIISSYTLGCVVCVHRRVKVRTMSVSGERVEEEGTSEEDKPPDWRYDQRSLLLLKSTGDSINIKYYYTAQLERSENWHSDWP